MAGGAGQVTHFSCFVFMSLPAVCSKIRPIRVNLMQQRISEATVIWSSAGPSSELTEGNAPTVPVPLGTDMVDLILVASNEDTSVIVGLQFLVDEWVVAAWKLEVVLTLGTILSRDLAVQCKQISGHVSNDGKQINILTGQGSCSVGYPMPCCFVSKFNLGDAPEWLQRKFLRAAIRGASIAAATERNGGVAPVVSPTFAIPDVVVDLIASLAGFPVTSDAPRREGELCFKNTHALWTTKTRRGQHRMTQKDHKRDNALVGSSFKPPIVCVPCSKQNGGIIHTPSGHTNHFWVSIANAIIARMKGYAWQVRLASIESEVATKLKELNAKIKLCESSVQSKEIKVRLGRVRRLLNKASNPQEKAALSVQEETILEELREMSSGTMLGNYNLIHAGTKDFLEVLKARPKKNSKRPESDLQFVLWRTIESRAGGCLDMKQSGLDQTNVSGLRSLQNCRKVFEALLGMYPADNDIHNWLTVEVIKWERLADALYDIGCFLKSQRKRSPEACDDKLLRLWCRWEDAFPGKSFNKFHVISCTIRESVHKYHMVGRILGESNVTRLTIARSPRPRKFCKTCLLRPS